MLIRGDTKLKPPRAIIFDIGRVIIPVNFAHLFEALAGRRGLSDKEVFQEFENDSLWQDWQEGRVTPQDWHKHISEKYCLSIDSDGFTRMWNSVLDRGTILSESLFERLSRSCRLALLSNTDPIHVAYIESTFPFVRHFPVRIYSCTMGKSKPGAEIYLHALRETGTLPEEAMFIDDLHENVLAAASIGMAAFHFTSPDELLTEFSRIGV